VHEGRAAGGGEAGPRRVHEAAGGGSRRLRAGRRGVPGESRSVGLSLTVGFQEVDAEAAGLTHISGGLEELSSILQVTQKKIRGFKVSGET
jgi:hypothetical protein